MLGIPIPHIIPQTAVQHGHSTITYGGISVVAFIVVLLTGLVVFSLWVRS